VKPSGSILARAELAIQSPWTASRKTSCAAKATVAVSASSASCRQRRRSAKWTAATQARTHSRPSGRVIARRAAAAWPAARRRGLSGGTQVSTVTRKVMRPVSRPFTPIQADAIPPALAGATCSPAHDRQRQDRGVPAADPASLMDKPRGTTRALVLTPTRELAAQILEDLNDLAVHTPLTGAAVFGGVGMGPQEHAFRSGVDVIVATPGRLLDHFRRPTRSCRARVPGARRGGPDARHGLPARHPPRAAHPAEAADAVLQRHDAAADRASSRARCCATRSINLERRPRRRRHHAGGLSRCRRSSRRRCSSSCCSGEMQDALVFTRTKHRANRLADYLGEARRQACERIHGNRSQAQRTEALAGFKSGRYRCSSRPTSRRAASTSRRSATWSTSTCRGARGLHPPRRPHRRAPR
jgi:hypothetical protein